MSIKSPLFDSIRVKPSQDRRKRTVEGPPCDWKGCDKEGTNRAPKGRNRENEYWHFCMQHVREYNAGYNFFSGMSTDDVSKYQKDALTGHRPTWKMGTGKAGPQGPNPEGAHDPFNVFREFGTKARPQEKKAEPVRTVHNAERKALNELGLDPGAEKLEIKARFKMLVKRHHPDANGGDTASEDKLREIIHAYNYLKSTGAC